MRHFFSNNGFLNKFSELRNKLNQSADKLSDKHNINVSHYLKNTLNDLLKVFYREKSNLLALDIGASSIKAIEISKKHNRLVLENYIIMPLPENCIKGHHIESYSVLTDKIKHIAHNYGYSNRDTAILLSGPQVVTQMLKLSSGLADHQLATHVELEAEKYLPFSTEEISLDFDVIDTGKKEGTETRVVMAATKKNYVDEYINILKASDLNLRIMDVYSCVMGRLATNVAPKQLDFNPLNKVIALVDIGSDILTISIFKNECQLYLKEQNFGGNILNEMIQNEHKVDFATAETLKFKYNDPAIKSITDNFIEQLTVQVFHLLQFFYSSLNSEKIDYIFIHGGCSMLPNLTELLAKKLGVESDKVNILDPFADIDTEKFSNDEKLQISSAMLATVCGLALRSYVE